MSSISEGGCKLWRVLKAMVVVTAVVLVAGTVAAVLPGGTAEPERLQEDKDSDGDSSVVSCEPGTSFIKVTFSDGSVYRYTYKSAGKTDVERMKALTNSGKALNAYIKFRNVKDMYDKAGSMPLVVTLPKSGIVLRLIPAGTFMMGSPESEDKGGFWSYPAVTESRHKVTISKPFYIGKYEVTQREWIKVMGSNPSKNKGNNLPVEQVNWHDCTNFMKKLAVLEGMPEGSFKLPTEAQWEYACRAGTTSVFCYGDSLDSRQANFNGQFPYGSGRKGTHRGKTVSVGEFKPNAWGLYDMHGNVGEWCMDWYAEYAGDATDPIVDAEHRYRVVRGGDWYGYADDCRSAARFGRVPGFTIYCAGFRLSMSAGQ